MNRPAILGVILSEAAFGGEVEESASQQPKRRKKNGSFGALRLLRMT